MAKYTVRLLMGVEAEDPEGAMREFIHYVSMLGFRTFTYAVEDDESGELWHVSGEGKVEPFDETLEPI